RTPARPHAHARALTTPPERKVQRHRRPFRDGQWLALAVSFQPRLPPPQRHRILHPPASPAAAASGGGLTDLEVVGAGHVAPCDQPAIADEVQRFMSAATAR